MSTQPPRSADDGPVVVAWDDGTIIVRVTHAGKEQCIRATGFNAWRLFAMLAMILGITLPSALARRIKIT